MSNCSSLTPLRKVGAGALFFAAGMERLGKLNLLGYTFHWARCMERV